MNTAQASLRRQAFRAIADMEFRVGLYWWLVGYWYASPSRGWVTLFPMAYVAVIAFTIGRPSLGSGIPWHPPVAAVLAILGGLLVVSFQLASLLAPEATVDAKRAVHHVASLLPVARSPRAWASAAARLAAMLVGLAAGTALWLGGRHLGVGPGEPPRSLLPLLKWLLAAVPLFLGGRIMLALGLQARRRLEAAAARFIVIAGWEAGLVVALVVGSRFPGLWQLTAGLSAGMLTSMAAVWGFSRARFTPRVIEWCYQQQGAATLQGGPSRDASAVAPVSRRPWWLCELGAAFAPELGWEAWWRAATTIFAVFGACGLCFAVGVPLAAHLVAHLRGLAATPRAADEWAWLPPACVFILSTAGLGFAVAVGGSDYTAPRTRHARALLPLQPAALWRARFLAAAIYSLGSLALGEALGIAGALAIGCTVGALPEVRTDYAWVALTLPALGLITFAQGPLLRNPFRLLPAALGTWAVLGVVASLGLMGRAIDAADVGRAYLWPAVAWPLALALVPLSRALMPPSAWSIGRDGRLNQTESLAVWCVLIVSVLASALVLCLGLLGPMAMMPG